MIGRRTPPKELGADAPPAKGFDDFDLRLGDIMRGERATLGKSLLDVQRELKIKATYIAAIENTDPTAFETPGFIAGYVRSYARYLEMDPEWAFATFCREAGFATVSGLDKQPNPRQQQTGQKPRKEGRDPFVEPAISFAPRKSSPFAAIEPGAIGSSLVLLSLLAVIGYGGWAVLQQIQQVQVSPIDQAPGVTAELGSGTNAPDAESDMPQFAGVSTGAPDSLDRLYRPEALDVPVMVARDGPISAVDPGRTGALAGLSRDRSGLTGSGLSLARAGDLTPPNVGETGANGAEGATNTVALADTVAPRVTAEDAPEVVLVAVRPAWVRVRASDGSILFEKTLNPGDTYVVPQTEEPPILRTGAAGALYFAVNGATYGPAGGNGAVIDGVQLGSSDLTGSYQVADMTNDPDAGRVAVIVAELAAQQPLPGQAAPTAD
ncbi:MAG: helix-turn-helix domain-containing protein [Celeribacter sp.]|jgi:hypothetical protein